MPRAVFNEMKKIPASTVLEFIYFKRVILPSFDIAFNEMYKFWITESKETVLTVLR